MGWHNHKDPFKWRREAEGENLGGSACSLLNFRMEEGTTSQGIQVVSRSEGKGKEMDSSFELPEGMQPDDALT